VQPRKTTSNIKRLLKIMQHKGLQERAMAFFGFPSRKKKGRERKEGKERKIGKGE